MADENFEPEATTPSDKGNKMASPNIIIITTDQQRCDSISCYGSSFTHTPNMDRLASEGAIFNRAYCTNPVCTPSRASIFSGQYPSRHGAWNVGTSIPEDLPMLSHYLTDLGYSTHYVGKAHFQGYFDENPQSIESGFEWEKTYSTWNGPYYGFDTVELCLGHTTYGIRGHYGLWVKSQVSEEEWKKYSEASSRASGDEFGGEAYDWEIPTRLHNSAWAAERSIAFLEAHDKQKPFFLAIGFQDPHHPHCVPTDLEDRVNATEVPLPNYKEGELADKPPHFTISREGNLESSEFRGDYSMAGQGPGFDYRKVSEAHVREGRAYYYSMVKLIDQELGRILECLDEQGLTENTLIIFTSDHGELLGDHGLWLKGPYHYEELINVPFLVRWPKGIKGGQSIDELVSLVDIVPTVLACLGEKQPAVEGVDFMPLLGSDTSTRNNIIVEFTDDPNNLRLKTVVTKDRKLTYYHGHNFGELYDLLQDPGEIVNQWDNPKYQEDKMKLLAMLTDHLERLENRAERYAYA